MNTTIRLALAAPLAALCLAAAAACGTETSAVDPPPQPTQSWHQSYKAPAEHPPGSFHADTYCRSHLNHGVIWCGSNKPRVEPALA